MNSWIIRTAELIGIRHADVKPSLSHLKLLIPEGRLCCVAAVVIGFFLVVRWQEIKLERAQRRKSHAHHQ